MILRVNILCLAAAIVGLIGLLLPWVTVTSNVTLNESHHSAEYFTAGLGQLWPGEGLLVWLAFGAFIVIAGTALAFTTPLGGIVQSAGLAMTLIGGYLGEDPYFFDNPDLASRTPGIGIYVAVAGAVMAVISIFVPIFLGTKKTAGVKDERFIAWTLGRGK